MRRAAFPTVIVAAIVLLIPSLSVNAADVKIDSSIRYQTIDGLGTFVYAPGWGGRMLSPEKFADLYVKDFGASIIRISVGPDASPKPDLDLDHLNLDKLDMNCKGVAPIGKALSAIEQRYPGKVKVFGSLWSPPGWMTDTGGTTHGGHLLANRREHLGKFIAAFCIDFEKTYGVHIDAVSLQNELRFSEFYDSCIYTPATFRDTIAAVGAQMKKWGCTTQLMGPEDVGADGDYGVQQEMGFIRAAEADPAAAKALDLFCVHGYGSDNTSASAGIINGWAELRDAVQGYNKRMWQTEISGEPHNLAGGLQVAYSIYAALALGNCSAWTYWQFFYGNPPEDLMNKVDTSEKKYCAAKHYIKYIRPGAVRVDCTGAGPLFFPSAYVNDADKSLTIVLLNLAKTAQPVRLSLPTYPRVQVFNVYRTSQTESFAALPDLHADAGSATLELPPQSVVTLVGIGTGDPPVKPTVATNLLAQPLNESVSLTWTAGWHANNYMLQRSTAEHGPFTVVASNLPGTSYTDTNLTDGKAYYYQVVSVSPEGQSPPSNIATAMPMAVAATYTDMPIRVDNAIESTWSHAQWYSMNHIVRGLASMGPQVTGRFKVMWDANNLYALLETTDPHLTVIQGKPFDSDGWEIYTDSTNSHRAVYGSADFHFVLPVGATQILEVAHNTDPGGACKSFPIPGGYAIKASIPLKALGVAGCNGETFGIDLNLTDNTPGHDRFKRAWWSSTDNDWQIPADFGAAKLTGATARIPADAPTITASAGNSSATLTWHPVPGAVGYLIQRAVHNQPLTTIDSISTAAPAPRPGAAGGSPAATAEIRYTDKGLDESSAYDYAVVPYSTGGPGAASKPVTVQPLVESAPPGSILIRCGGPASARFSADEDFIGGLTATNYVGPIVRNVADPAPAEVYQSERYGKFSYKIPGLTPGKAYLVRLHFCENYCTAPGQRVFSVAFNGTDVLPNFDTFKDAGGEHAAVIREFPFTAPADGTLNITFTAKANQPSIHALEVIPK